MFRSSWPLVRQPVRAGGAPAGGRWEEAQQRTGCGRTELEHNTHSDAAFGRVPAFLSRFEGHGAIRLASIFKCPLDVMRWRHRLVSWAVSISSMSMGSCVSGVICRSLLPSRCWVLTRSGTALMDFRLEDCSRVGRRLMSPACSSSCSSSCFLWFFLFLGAASLLVLVHLQDLTQTLLQRSPGLQMLIAPKYTAEMDAVSASLVSPVIPSATKRHWNFLKNSSVSNAPAEGEESLQDSRRRRLADFCSRYHLVSEEQAVSREQVSRVFVEDRSRLLYCEVPKAGCSNWKRVLMVLGGRAASTRDIPHDAVHYGNSLRRLESYDHAAISERLHSFTKVLFVREPFERLVSAFRDKFESPNSYYHTVFGRPIISKYRANATRSALQSGTGVTFREFVQYLLDVQRPVGMDIHWEPMGQLCSPCLLHYDFIGKFEYLEDEANFLLRSVGAPTNLTFPNFKDRNPHERRTSSSITRRYFSQLNATERQKTFDFYYMDYLMFDYPKPFKDLH